MPGAKIAIVIYSTYGHIVTMAEAVKTGVESAGGEAHILQVRETLPEEVLTKMGAPPKADYPVAEPMDLAQYDGLILGIATRFGGWPAQLKSFWDATGQLWMSGALYGKFAAAFVSTGGQGGGQEGAFFSILSTLAHHGLMYVPLGYAHTTALWNSHNEEVHGGSPFGAGTFSNAGTNPRVPSEVELETAKIQGREFFKIVNRGPKAPVSN